MTSDYRQFLASKRSYKPDSGFELDPAELNPMLFPWQGDCVRYGLRRGSCALLEECGLGKSFQQLEWAYQVARHTGGNVLLFCPLAVAGQTLREAARFDISREGRIPIMIAKAQDEIPFVNGIVISNYDKLHHFQPEKFAAVVLDESSILKNMMGKMRNKLCESFSKTPFRLACTATPSPNDQTELGNHSEFLGQMRHSEMLGRFFVNQADDNKGYRLRKHAVGQFWDWVSTWAISLETPADLGYPADGYVLPPLEIYEHEVEADDTPTQPGQLFANESINATTIHREKRMTNIARAEVVAGLTNNSTDSWIVWCDTDYEADELAKRIPDAVEVRGSFSEFKKEQAIEKFSTGQARIIITKPDICGHGLNWQHCHKIAFVGLSYSFERFYQAVRRSYRFGQKMPVEVHVVNSAAEQVVWRTVKWKEEEHRLMKKSMSGAMLASQMEHVRGISVNRLRKYEPGQDLILPEWMVRA